MSLINETHDINLTSWVASANVADCDFPIQNLPFAEVRRKNSNEAFRGAVAIGDQVIDLAKLNELAIFSGDAQTAIAAASNTTLNEFMSLGQQYWSALRLALSKALREGSEHQTKLSEALIAQADIEFALPCRIGDYTDFYTSIYHATAVGSLFRPDNPLLPNYKWVPIGYHGRSSSIGVSRWQELPEQWNNTKKIAITVKQVVAPLQANEVFLFSIKKIFDRLQEAWYPTESSS